MDALRALAAAASQRQAGLAARLARLQDVSANLSERAALLASLHWSLPRPPSEAEQQLNKQLEVRRGRLGPRACWPGWLRRQHMRVPFCWPALAR